MTSQNRGVCSRCGGDLPTPKYEGDDPPTLNGNPICYECWGIEHKNRDPLVINYRMTSFVRGQGDIMEHTVIRLDQLPQFIDELFRRPGYWVEYVLLEKGCNHYGGDLE